MVALDTERESKSGGGVTKEDIQASPRGHGVGATHLSELECRQQ